MKQIDQVSVLPQERSMSYQRSGVNVAYVILAHKQPNQLLRLVRCLDSPRSHFLIHISRNAEAGFNELIRAVLAKRSNCTFLPRQFVRWGRFGLTKAIFDAFDVVMREDMRPDYLTIVSGQDYPVAGREHVEQVLLDNWGSTLLEVGEVPTEMWGPRGLDRFHVRHLRLAGMDMGYPPFIRRDDWVGNMSRRITKGRAMPHGFTPFGGSSWFSLTTEAIAYLFEFRHSVIGRDFLRFFATVLHPEEMLFHTILMNSELAERMVRSEFRYIDWSVNERHPSVLGLDDLDAVVASGAMFARKFDETASSDLMDALDTVARVERCLSPQNW